MHDASRLKAEPERFGDPVESREPTVHRFPVLVVAAHPLDRFVRLPIGQQSAIGSTERGECGEALLRAGEHAAVRIEVLLIARVEADGRDLCREQVAEEENGQRSVY